MAIALTAIARNANQVVYSVTCLDADTTVTVQHLLGAKPQELIFTPAISLASTAAGQFSLAATATDLVVTKLNVAGSGGTTPGTTVVGYISAKYLQSFI